METEHIPGESDTGKVISIGRAVPLQTLLFTARIDRIIGFGERIMCVSLARPGSSDRPMGQRVPPALLKSPLQHN